MLIIYIKWCHCRSHCECTMHITFFHSRRNAWNHEQNKQFLEEKKTKNAVHAIFISIYIMNGDSECEVKKEAHFRRRTWNCPQCRILPIGATCRHEIKRNSFHSLWLFIVHAINNILTCFNFFRCFIHIHINIEWKNRLSKFTCHDYWLSSSTNSSILVLVVVIVIFFYQLFNFQSNLRKSIFLFVKCSLSNLTLATESHQTTENLHAKNICYVLSLWLEMLNFQMKIFYFIRSTAVPV